MNQQFRVRLNDPLNWVIEKFHPGGEKITRGKFVNQLTKEAWKIVGYYPTLEEAYKSLLNKQITELTLNESKTVLEIIGKAKQEILNLINETRT